MTNTNALFNQVDINHDGRVSREEFREFLAQNPINGGAGSSNFSVSNDYNNLETAGGGYGASAFRSSTYDASATGGGGFGADLGYAGAGYGTSSYESSSFRSSVGSLGGDMTNLNVAGTAGLSSTDATSASLSSASQSSSIQHYETDAQGNFKDSNPQIVRRPAPNGPVTYTQNIKVRFLQPPAVPPPGVR